MNQNQLSENINMLDTIYDKRQIELEKEANMDRQMLATKLHPSNIEQVKEAINQYIQDQEERESILNILDEVIENYQIRAGFYNEKYYKQGFKDAIKLCLECCQE